MFFLKKNVRVIIKNLNLALEIKSGANLYQALVKENVIPPTLCRGNGQCGKCKVHISQKNQSKPNKKEQLVLARINLDAGFRLACQTIIKDDMSVDTSEITSPAAQEEFVVRVRHSDTKNSGDTPNSTAQHAEGAAIKAPSVVESLATVNLPTYTAPNTSKAIIVGTTAANMPSVHTEQQNPTTIAIPTSTTLPTTAVTLKYTPPSHYTSKSKVAESEKQALDGLLLVQNKRQVRYFLYSAAIDSVAQEGTIENVDSVLSYVHHGGLLDFVHSQLNVKDIDRIIVLSDELGDDGENLFDIASYYAVNLGDLQCEVLRPMAKAGDLNVLLRMLSSKSKNRLIISLDKLDKAYYIAESKLVQLPSKIGTLPRNLFDLVKLGNNPVINISDDLKVVTAQNRYVAPDCLPLPFLMKVVVQMMKRKLVDADYNIIARGMLDSAVPLDYVVKVVQYGDSNAFYLHRSKDSSLLITQDMLSSLVQARNYIHYAVDFTESNLGSIDNITICTPQPIPDLVSGIVTMGLVPKRHENILMHNAGDSSVMAVKLFQGADVCSYLYKNYGSFSKADLT